MAAQAAVQAETASDRLIRVGLIGAGGRGTGALQQTLSVPGSNVKVTAIADAFEDRIKSAQTGFSMKTCLPAFTAASKWNGRNPGGVARITMSQCSSTFW